MAEWAGQATKAQVVGASVRSLLSVALMVVVYYLAPLDRALDLGAGVRLAIGLGGLTVALVWQTRAIIGSTRPRLRAAETVAVGLPFLLLLYASVYLLMSYGSPESFNQPLGRTGALYFTLTVFATVGFGDIVPVSDAARIATMTQMIVGLVAVGVVAKLLLGAVHRAVSAQEAAQDAPGRRPPPG